MRSLRSRFIISHSLPILLVVPLVTLILLYLLETQIILDQMSDDITDKATLIAAAINRNPELMQDVGEAESFIAGIALYGAEQIYLLGPNGQVLASSDEASGQNSGETIEMPGLDTAITGDQSLVINYGLAEQAAVVLIPVKDINEQLIGIVGVSDTLAGAASQISQLRMLVCSGLLLELLLGILIGIYMARRLERPITRAATAVIDIADGYEIDPVPVRGPAEIRDLERSVNTLAERLHLLEETRHRSLANIVHELGRPLGAIRSAVYVLRHGADEDPQVRDELLSGIEASIENMQPLLDDLALLHGQVQGTIQLHRQQVAISDWLPPLLLPWRAVVQEKGLNWQTDIPPNLPTLQLDPDRMAQAVDNLISNAVKYTPPGGAISITAASTEKDLLIQIKDSGPGIRPEEQERVFEAFYRSRAQRRFPVGLGLGLTIARDMVEAHDGLLQLASTPGEGSCFTIRLPLTPALPHVSTVDA
jgi:two-component system sensor histidine kinase BaeS